MKKRIETSHHLAAPIEKVWNHVRTGAQWENWMPIVASSTIEGEGTGATRVCRTHDNGDLYETILRSDDLEKIFQYRIDQQEMLPVSNIIGTMKFSEHEQGTYLEWAVEFDMTDESSFAEIKTNTEQLYAATAQQLTNFSNQ